MQADSVYLVYPVDTFEKLRRISGFGIKIADALFVLRSVPFHLRSVTLT